MQTRKIGADGKGQLGETLYTHSLRRDCASSASPIPTLCFRQMFEIIFDVYCLILIKFYWHKFDIESPKFNF